MDKPNWSESTSAMLARRAPGLAWLPVAMRKHFTPAALGSAITGIAISIGYVLNAQHDISRLKDSGAEQAKQLESVSSALHRIELELAVVNNTMNNVSDEVDRQREWRERIEDVAESGPHGRVRRKP